MSELAITFNMVKANGEDFTDSEIDEFNEEFITLVEKHGYLVGGSIGPYSEDDECSDDVSDMDFYDDDSEFFDTSEDIDYPDEEK